MIESLSLKPMLLKVHFKEYQKWRDIFLVICLITVFSAFFSIPKIIFADTGNPSDYPATDSTQKGCEEQTIDSTENNMTVPVSQLLSPEYVAAQNRAYTLYYKTCVLDVKAQALAKEALQKLTESIVKWIDTGIGNKNGTGNPTYVQNTGDFFGKLTDSVAGNTIESISPSIASPFRTEVTLALANSYTGQTRDQELATTLTNPDADFQTFTNGTGGSWDLWFNVTQHPQNNPYGASMIASAQVSNAVASAQNKYQQQLDWGRGFLNYEDCPSDAKNSSSVSGGAQVYDANHQPVYGVWVNDQGCKIKTPGATIQGQIDLTLGSDMRGLEVAQTMDQVLPALTGQLMSQSLGFENKGLIAAGSNTSGYANGASISLGSFNNGVTNNSSSGYAGNSFDYQSYINQLLSLANTNKNTGTTGGTVTIPSPTIACLTSTSTVSLSSSTPVVWSAQVTGGVSPFVYSWQGDEGLSGTASTTTKLYSAVGIKGATVIVIDANSRAFSHQCGTTTVTVTQ